MKNCQASKVDDKTLIFSWIRDGKFETVKSLLSAKSGRQNPYNQQKVTTGRSGKDAFAALDREVTAFRKECLDEAATGAAKTVSRHFKGGDIVTYEQLKITDEQHGNMVREMAAAAKTSTAARSALKGARERERGNQIRLEAPMPTPPTSPTTSPPRSPPRSPPSSPTPGTPVPSPPLSPSRPPPY